MKTLNRRHFLRGIGTAVAIPTLEAALPTRAAAATTAGLATTATGAPLRSAFIYFPNGAILDHWNPSGTGNDYQMAKTMQPLEGLRDHFQVVSGLAHDNAEAGPDGAGDHARANATFLTGLRARKTSGSDIELGTSIDQVAASEISDLTRFGSLELSCDGVRKSGGCDSGYSCAYQYNISWRSSTTPMTPESNPRLLFERLFGAGSKEQRLANLQLRQKQQRSVLDFILEDANTLNKQLGRTDKLKLDEYLTGVREIEKRIEKAERFKDLPDPGVPAPEAGVPNAYTDHINLLYDLMVLAFQTDSTRVATFMLAHDGSNRSFQEIGVSDGHHNLSHHRRDQVKMDKIQKIDHFYVQHFAGFLKKLSETKDSDGNSLLHNSQIVYGSGHSDADRHDHDKLPVIVAGNAGGKLTPGRHLDTGRTPMSNMYLGMLDNIGVKRDRFGDSTGILKTI
ncbi:MAG: DUF1552 domain-containing protein [Verrucomicrobiales bacterium]|nr:DUF1552 domain-containing protein [Verrucomicrobiales bacterium]